MIYANWYPWVLRSNGPMQSRHNGTFGMAEGLLTDIHCRTQNTDVHPLECPTMSRLRVLSQPKWPATGLWWAAWKTISRRLFGINNCLTSSADWVSLYITCPSPVKNKDALAPPLLTTFGRRWKWHGQRQSTVCHHGCVRKSSTGWNTSTTGVSSWDSWCTSPSLSSGEQMANVRTFGVYVPLPSLLSAAATDRDCCLSHRLDLVSLWERGGQTWIFFVDHSLSSPPTAVWRSSWLSSPAVLFAADSKPCLLHTTICLYVSQMVADFILKALSESRFNSFFYFW